MDRYRDHLLTLVVFLAIAIVIPVVAAAWMVALALIGAVLGL